MKNLILKFTSKDKLKKFIEKKIPNDKNILIQIFSGIIDEELIKNVTNILKENIKNAKIIGCTTDGEIINGDITTNTIVINFTIFEKTEIKTKIIEKNELSDFEMGEKLATFLKEENTKCFIVFTDGLHTDGEEFIKGLNSKTDVLIAGGMAGDNGNFLKTLVFNEEKIISNGCVGVSLNSNELIVHNEYNFDWQGIGRKMTITKADKNIIYEIDNKKTIDVYKHYFGEELTTKIISGNLKFPILINKNNKKIAINVIKKNSDNSGVIVNGNVKENDEIEFGFGDFNSLLENKKEIEINNVESVFIYSNMAKRRLLGDCIKYKISNIKNISSIAGFFTYGEFYKDKKKYLLNQATNILFLSENKDNSIIKEKNYCINNIINDNLLILNAVTNLINKTHKEFEDRLKYKMDKIKAKNLELEYLYYHDELTELKNKNALKRDISKLNEVNALLIDIKKFLSINDMYGDEIGDLILKKFSKELLKIIKENELELYRVAGDQFFILNKNGEIENENISNKIFKYFKENNLFIEVEKNEIYIELNFRIAIVPNSKYETCKTKAELALNYAKKHKKDIIVYSEELKLEENLLKEIETIEMVKKAIKEDRVVPVFQKIEKKDSVSYECLIRIKDVENNKLISPFFFLDTIKHTKYYQELTKIMINKCFKYFENKKYHFSINFSFDDIINDETVQYLCDMIDKHKMYNRVIIELLETEAIEDFEKLEKFIKIVRSYGAKVAIDDFGSGYSNFIYLTKLSPDFIKIDGSLIKNIHIDKKALIITKNVNNFAKEIGCQTIAEFVHNEDVFKILKTLDIHGLQGYYLDEPKEEICD